MVLFTVAILSACAQRVFLMPKSAVVPSGVDLSGLWTIQRDSRDTFRTLDEAGIEAAGGRRGLVETARRSRARRGGGPPVHIFLETASKLKITQTAYGLFVSFDRSIVEEYRFGENRPVSVGPVVAARVSGWEDGGYVVETLDENNNRLVERYVLGQGGSVLTRQISIWEREALQLSVEQRFDRS